MTANALKWVFDQKNLRPDKVAHRVNGTLSLSWHVDDNDDRFVGVSSSVNFEDFMLLMRDGRKVEAVVLNDADQIVSWVRQRLIDLKSRSGLINRQGS